MPRHRGESSTSEVGRASADAEPSARDERRPVAREIRSEMSLQRFFLRHLILQHPSRGWLGYYPGHSQTHSEGGLGDTEVGMQLQIDRPIRSDSEVWEGPAQV